MSELTGAGNGIEAPPPQGSPFTRAQWISLLARAVPERMESVWNELTPRPAYRMTRPPEIALVMVRARAGGSGQRFNLGEATVSRCAVTTATGALGIGYVRGRDLRHAELAALFDALLQDPGLYEMLLPRLLLPLQREQDTARALQAEETAATRVEFFTLVRGENS